MDGKKISGKQTEANQDKENKEDSKKKEKQNNKDGKDDKDFIYNKDSNKSFESLEIGEKESQDNEGIPLQYDLSKKYFVKINDYFKNFTDNKNIKRTFHFTLNNNQIPYEEDFNKVLKNNDMLYKLFLETKKNVENSVDINILKNGLFYKNKKLLFYCRKDEKIEDNYIADIANLEYIDFKEYDKIDIIENKENTIEDKFAKSEKIRDNNSAKYYNKSENRFQFKKNNYSCQSGDIKKQKSNKITGLKNRAIELEALVHFYFKELMLVSLPEIIFNLNYKKTNFGKKKPTFDDINLYYEWDGCFLCAKENNSKKNFISPFHKEKKFVIESGFLKSSNINEERFQIQKNSFIFLEVKTHFPKTKEEDENQNLENLIKLMFKKLNYYIELYSRILEKDIIKNIYIILLYNQQRITKYKDTLFKKINEHKECFVDVKKYIIYFHVFYIFPSIGRLSLNYITEKLDNNYKHLEKENNKAQKEIKEANEKIKNLEEQNMKAKNDANEKIKNLEEENNKAQKEIKEANEKIKNLEQKVNELKSMIENLSKNSNIIIKQTDIPQLKSESSKNNNN